jgi:hypothetical protein
MVENCAICGCVLNRSGDYAKPTIQGRSHATRHHFVAERFFGRSANRPHEIRDPIFKECPWALEGKAEVYCYECHEELLHNPVLTPNDIRRFSELVKFRGLEESEKTESREKLAGRISLLHEVIEIGLLTIVEAELSNP